jgi:hypothetical protein
MPNLEESLNFALYREEYKRTKKLVKRGASLGIYDDDYPISIAMFN